MLDALFETIKTYLNWKIMDTEFYQWRTETFTASNLWGRSYHGSAQKRIQSSNNPFSWDIVSLLAKKIPDFDHTSESLCVGAMRPLESSSHAGLYGLSLEEPPAAPCELPKLGLCK